MTATTSPVLLLERAGAIATLRFNRPGALNAIDVPMATALLAAVRSIAKDNSVRCVVLCGAGKGFMAGGDLATLRADPAQGAKDLLTPLNEAVALLAHHGLLCLDPDRNEAHAGLLACSLDRLRVRCIGLVATSQIRSQ